ncbi:MAG: hypothetical protein GY832_17030 [Chloroflexi bacterium]|nr:hypothetical protein [Chloroflexota bacterium]
MPSNSRLQRKKRELGIFQTQYNLLSERVKRLRASHAIEAGTAVRFQLEQEIEQAETERRDVEQQIDSLEDEIRKLAPKKTEKTQHPEPDIPPPVSAAVQGEIEEFGPTSTMQAKGASRMFRQFSGWWRRFIQSRNWAGWQGILALLALLVALGAWFWPDIAAIWRPEPSCELAITDLNPAKENLSPNETTHITVAVQDCGESLTYVWSADNGQVEPSGLTAYSTITYTAPGFVGPDTIEVAVRDASGRIISGDIQVSVVQGSDQ